jgi:hypothetical protein
VEARRYVVERPADDGMVSIQLRLLPEEAARVMKAFEVAGRGNRADGAVAVADAALGGKLPGDGGSVRPPVEVVVHVQARDLEGETELGDGISAEVSRRLLCDAGVVPILEDERGKTIDVGRRTRTIPAALRRALDARDGGCRFPGCSNRIFTDAHHVEHWLDPRGKEIPAQGPRWEVAADLATVVSAWSGRPVNAEVNAPGWDGERVDYELCVAALA